jgi:hypothetical protein
MNSLLQSTSRFITEILDSATRTLESLTERLDDLAARINPDMPEWRQIGALDERAVFMAPVLNPNVDDGYFVGTPPFSTYSDYQEALHLVKTADTTRHDEPEEYTEEETQADLVDLARSIPTLDEVRAKHSELYDGLSWNGSRWVQTQGGPQ